MKKWLIWFVLLALPVGSYLGWKVYGYVFGANVDTNGKGDVYFHVHTGWSFEDVQEALLEKGWLKDYNSFALVAERKNYPNMVKPGRYKVEDGISNAALIDLLRSGEQEPVNLTFNNVRDLPDLAGKLAKNIEPDSVQMIKALEKKSTISHYGFEPQTFVAMFLPNTYHVNWNSSPKDVIARMAHEYKAFWNDQRRKRANELGLDPVEVTTLASIVKAETSWVEDRKRIAGVYINRLKIGMPLQADPTLVFALGRDVQRVLNHHKQIESPYNTYKYKGLPPGPINLPEPAYIDAVLNYEDHDYLYFCAAEDLSGRSNFSKTYSQHLVYARRYQRALNERGIYR